MESWNFQHLFDLGFCENLQNLSSFTQTFRQHFSIATMSWNFVRFHEIINQRYAENFRFLTFDSKQNGYTFATVYRSNCLTVFSIRSTMDSSFFSQQMAPWRPNFSNPRGKCFKLHKGSKTTWTEFCHFLTPSPSLRGQFLYPEHRQKLTFLTPSPLILST